MAITRMKAVSFLEKKTSLPLLDIRSPGEYEKGHIPGANSFPLFTNEERAIIGTLYKNEGKHVAVKRGLQIVGPKLAEFVNQAEKFQSDKLTMYCWRGGMRSDSMAWLLDKAGFDILLLEGGYKAFRNGLMEYFRRPLPLIVLTGYTGSKKTALLHMLREQGEQIIDLEGLASHQGSSFGNQKTNGQPTSEQFQNLIYESCRHFDRSRPIWLEDECLRIGNVTLIDDLYRQMNDAPRIFLEVPMEERIEFLVQDYGQLPEEKLIEGTLGIRKKLGSEKTEEAITSIRDGDLHKAVQIILSYYDRYYLKSISKKESTIIRRIVSSMKSLPEVAVQLSQTIHHAI
ncbi:MAG: tRNA 2-selenouridine(34) synthase MnmH [Saprospiraceae bacterium]|nr:tRNA 2-selenouridine(34) synthase MnmH [Saprospiraceae bacterium]